MGPPQLAVVLLRRLSWVRVRNAIILALIAKRWALPTQQGVRQRVSAAARHAAVAEARRLVPPPPAKDLGGERVTTDTYCRFLSVKGWDPQRAAKLLKADLEWRAKYKPRALRPRDMPNACAQRGWIVLLSTVGGRAPEAASQDAPPPNALHGVRQRMRRGLGLRWAGGIRKSGELQPPHNRPPLQQWRCTRSGMPITLFEAKGWQPEKCSHAERVRHVSYHMEQYIRRMPTPMHMYHAHAHVPCP